nr:AIR synthase-related protein [Mangrovicoccus ximenensis]
MTVAAKAEAAAALAPRAHAMTDVTGFGLAGHALEMAEASGAAIELKLKDVPLCEGALELCKAGIRSTIFEDNRAAAIWKMTGKTGKAKAQLLHDPQTCGGLLAALPPMAAMEAVAAIAAAGGEARVIGRVSQGAPGLHLA